MTGLSRSSQISGSDLCEQCGARLVRNEDQPRRCSTCAPPAAGAAISKVLSALQARRSSPAARPTRASSPFFSWREGEQLHCQNETVLYVEASGRWAARNRSGIRREGRAADLATAKIQALGGQTPRTRWRCLATLGLPGEIRLTVLECRKEWMWSLDICGKGGASGFADSLEEAKAVAESHVKPEIINALLDKYAGYGIAMPGSMRMLAAS